MSSSDQVDEALAALERSLLRGGERRGESHIKKSQMTEAEKRAHVAARGQAALDALGD